MTTRLAPVAACQLPMVRRRSCLLKSESLAPFVSMLSSAATARALARDSVSVSIFRLLPIHLQTHLLECDQRLVDQRLILLRKIGLAIAIPGIVIRRIGTGMLDSAFDHPVFLKGECGELQFDRWPLPNTSNARNENEPFATWLQFLGRRFPSPIEAEISLNLMSVFVKLPLEISRLS